MLSKPNYMHLHAITFPSIETKRCEACMIRLSELLP